MNENSNIPRFFLGIILIAFSFIGSAIIMHAHEFSKDESANIQNDVKILS